MVAVVAGAGTEVSLQMLLVCCMFQRVASPFASCRSFECQLSQLRLGTSISMLLTTGTHRAGTHPLAAVLRPFNHIHGCFAQIRATNASIATSSEPALGAGRRWVLKAPLMLGALTRAQMTSRRASVVDVLHVLHSCEKLQACR